MACLAVLAVVLFLIVRPAMFGGQGLHTPPADISGPNLGAPADPANPYSAARPEWYFLFLFQFLKLFEGHGAAANSLGAIVVPGMVMRLHVSDAVHRAMEAGALVECRLSAGCFVGIVWLTFSAYREDHRVRSGSNWQTYGPEFADVQDVLRDARRPAKDRHVFPRRHGESCRFPPKLDAYQKVKKSIDYLAAVKLADDDARRAKELACATRRGFRSPAR